MLKSWHQSLTYDFLLCNFDFLKQNFTFYDIFFTLMLKSKLKFDFLLNNSDF